MQLLMRVFFVCLFAHLYSISLGQDNTSRLVSSRNTLINDLLKQPASLGRDTSIIRYKLDIFNAYAASRNIDSAKNWKHRIFTNLSALKWEAGWGYYYRTLGYYYVFANKPDSATIAYLKSIKIWEKLGQWREVGIASARLGMALAGESKTEKALFYLNKALEIFRKSNDYFSQANVFNYLADTYRILKDFPTALAYYRKTIALVESGKAPSNVLISQAIGTMYLQNNLPDSAIIYFNKSGRNPIKDPKSISDSYVANRLAEYFLSQQDYAKAEVYARQSLMLGEKGQAQMTIKRANLLLYQAFKGLGKSDSALMHYEASIDIMNKLNNAEIEKKIDELEVQYQTKRKEAEINRQKRQLSENQLALLKKTSALQLANKNLELNEQKLARESAEKKLRNEQFEKISAQQNQRISQLNLEKQVEQQAQNQIFIGAGILLLLIFSGFVIWRNYELRRKNREISESLLQGQALERKRVAADLHDNLGATMSSLLWTLDAIDTPKLQPSERQIYQNLKQMVANAYNEVRLLSHNLLPEEFEKQGLAEALRYLVRKINQNATIRFGLQIYENLGKLDKKVEFELYSICLELANNIIKHSQATEATIALARTDRHIELLVSDNGKGIFENNSDGKGMKNVRARVESMGGVWEMATPEGKGVQNQIVIPV